MQVMYIKLKYIYLINLIKLILQCMQNVHTKMQRNTNKLKVGFTKMNVLRKNLLNF